MREASHEPAAIPDKQEGGASDELWQVVREPAVVSRWLLFGSEAFQTVLLLGQHRLGKGALILLGGILAYNAASLWAVRRPLLHHRRAIASLLIVDLLLVCAAAYVTGASKSPFLGQFYLIIFAGALFFGVTGGIATGIASAALTLSLGADAPDGLRQDIRDLIPYFAIAGGFTGYLSDRVREAARQRRNAKEEARERAREEEGQRNEMRLARTIQESAAISSGLLVDDDQFEIALHRVFARDVGGDFALLFPDTDVRALLKTSVPGTLGLAVGDVSGKGVPAALTANSVTYLLPWLRPLDDAETALASLNQDLERRLPVSAFVTLVLAEISTPSDNGEEAGQIRLWSAGHPPALVWHAASRFVTVAEEDIGGPVLGVFPQWKATSQTVPFAPDDILVLYTDGLTETRRPADGEQLGTERVADLIAAYAAAGEGAATLSQSLACAAAAWGPQQDDLTILACRRKHPSPP